MDNQNPQTLCDALFQACQAGDYQNLSTVVPNLSHEAKLEQIRLVTAKRDEVATSEETRSAADFLLGLLTE